MARPNYTDHEVNVLVLEEIINDIKYEYDPPELRKHIGEVGTVYRYPDGTTDTQVNEHMLCPICFPKSKVIENYHGNVTG